MLYEYTLQGANVSEPVTVPEVTETSAISATLDCDGVPKHGVSFFIYLCYKLEKACIIFLVNKMNMNVLYFRMCMKS